jgi:hypothetical protein
MLLFFFQKILKRAIENYRNLKEKESGIFYDSDLEEFIEHNNSEEKEEEKESEKEEKNYKGSSLKKQEVKRN